MVLKSAEKKEEETALLIKTAIATAVEDVVKRQKHEAQAAASAIQKAYHQFQQEQSQIDGEPSTSATMFMPQPQVSVFILARL